MTIRDVLAGIDPDLLLMDGYDDCILGVAERCDRTPLFLTRIDQEQVSEVDQRAALGPCGK